MVDQNAAPSERIRALGLTLPAAAQPSFNYVPVVITGDLAFVSGQLPKVDGEVRCFGLLGAEISEDQGREAARICALQSLACLEAALGSLDRISRIVKLTGFVASAPGFYRQPFIVDAASDLMVDVFGESGRHARSAVGVASLPRNAPVEVELVVAISRPVQGQAPLNSRS